MPAACTCVGIETESSPEKPPHHSAAALVLDAVLAPLYLAEQAAAWVATLASRIRCPPIPNAPARRA
eukprot:5888365-Pyramimonas_sp.AAC.1